MLALPCLLWAGLPLPEAIAAMSGVVTVHGAYNLWRVRHFVPKRETLTVVGARTLLLPVGVGLMERFAHDPLRSRQAVGAAICLALAALHLRGKLGGGPASAAAAGWARENAGAAGAGGVSGLLAGLVGIGGPPLVLYAALRNWPKERFRAFLWASFLAGVPVGMAALVWRFGWGVTRGWALGLSAAPFVWLGSRAGLALSARWNTLQLHRAAKSLVLALALTGLAAPWLSPAMPRPEAGAGAATPRKASIFRR